MAFELKPSGIRSNTNNWLQVATPTQGENEMARKNHNAGINRNKEHETARREQRRLHFEQHDRRPVLGPGSEHLIRTPEQVNA
jgi:hypothetical protein